MDFIPVITNISGFRTGLEFYSAIIRQTDSCLISLIDAFKQKNFGLDTLYKVKKVIRKFREVQFEGNANVLDFRDSGGYSFIKGDIHPMDLIKLIDCYSNYLVTEQSHYSFIFALDLPVSLKYKSFNTQEFVHNYNRISLEQSIQAMIDHPSIRDRFFFIWQFRQKEQYIIWDKLYRELELGKIIRNRAIGGMVGIKGLTGIDYSPFIAIAFRCFKDYMDTGMYDHAFRLHLLGINSPSDRFIGIVLERLFQQYMKRKGFKSEAKFTYDSINFSVSGFFQARTIKVFQFEKGQYIGIDNVPDEIIQKVYFTQKLYDRFLKDRHSLSDGKKLSGTETFVPLNLHSLLEVDRLFEYLIDSFNIGKIFFDCTFMHELRPMLKYILKELSKEIPEIFTDAMIRSLISSFEKIWRLHYWYQNFGDYKSLDQMNRAFIEMIGIPKYLN